MYEGIENGGGDDAFRGALASCLVFIVALFIFARRLEHRQWHRGRIAILWAVPIAGLFLGPLKAFVIPLLLGAAVLTWYWLPDERR
jgi:hypothetical protein